MSSKIHSRKSQFIFNWSFFILVFWFFLSRSHIVIISKIDSVATLLLPYLLSLVLVFPNSLFTHFLFQGSSATSHVVVIISKLDSVATPLPFSFPFYHSFFSGSLLFSWAFFPILSSSPSFSRSKLGSIPTPSFCLLSLVLVFSFPSLLTFFFNVLHLLPFFIYSHSVLFLSSFFTHLLSRYFGCFTYRSEAGFLGISNEKERMKKKRRKKQNRLKREGKKNVWII